MANPYVVVILSQCNGYMLPPGPIPMVVAECARHRASIGILLPVALQGHRPHGQEVDQ